MELRTLIEQIEENSLVPEGNSDRFAGYAVVGLPFLSGHLLALRRFPASSLGPSYTSIWHRCPGETWTFYSTVAAEQSCSRYFGDETDHNVQANIQIVCTGPDTLRVVAQCSRPLTWEITVAETAASRLINFAARQLPDTWWKKRFMLRVMGLTAQVILGTGKINLAGRTPRGYEFIANPKQVWLVKSSQAVVDGVDLGPAGPLSSQARLNDFVMPQKGLFAVASAFMQSPSPMSDAVLRSAGPKPQVDRKANDLTEGETMNPSMQRNVQESGATLTRNHGTTTDNPGTIRIIAGRLFTFLYGLASYAAFLVTFLYAIGFVGNFAVPKSMDSASADPWVTALMIDAGLLALFALQHSVMARAGFKRLLTRVIPVAMERSTYVLASSVALLLLFWQWRPLGGTVWDVHSNFGRVLLYGAYAFGWLLVLVATVVINHFDLFGLRQVWRNLLGRPQENLRFVMPFLYRIVRHPLYVGWLFVFWGTPTMTVTHLFFAIMTTAYILIAIQFEERDLMREHPEYVEYRKRVPMLIPGSGKTRTSARKVTVS